MNDPSDSIRGDVTAYATSIAGTSAVSDYQKYVSIIAPGETISTQASMATLSSCGLTVAGIWRGCGYYGEALNAPYVNGTAVSRVVDIGQDARGYIPYKQGLLPSPGDMILLENPEHVYTVISVASQPDGSVVIQSVDGGFPSGGTEPGSGGDAIVATQHTWRNGQDTDPYCTRPIAAIIDVTKVLTSSQMPLSGFVQAALPGSLGVDCAAVITESMAAAIKAAGYIFCARGVSPNETAVLPLTAAEAGVILAAGLGLLIMQRVDASTLGFSSSLGTQHGSAAATSAVSIGIPMCVNVWLLLENIPPKTSSSSLIAYYNAWYTAVDQAGLLPGLRVGTSEVLNSTQLGDLAFCHYWRSSGVSVSPTPRGYQLVEGSSVTVGGTQMNQVTAQNDAGTGSSAGPGQAEWLIANP